MSAKESIRVNKGKITIDGNSGMVGVGVRIGEEVGVGVAVEVVVGVGVGVCVGVAVGVGVGVGIGRVPPNAYWVDSAVRL